MSRRSPPQAKSQRAVREARFEATLEAFNQEIAAKTAMTLGEYHRRWVDPLEQRIANIELWLGIRAARWIQAKVVGLYRKVRDRLFPEPPALPAMTEMPVVEQAVEVVP